jgi:hypothetical protein
MTDPGLGTFVRYWLHYSNMASSFYKQYCSAKKVKDDYEKQIIANLQQNGMENATIQIGGGQLNVVDKREPGQLSLIKIEGLLHGFYKQRGGKDETEDVMRFIRANRGYSMNKYLKQSGMPTPGGGAAAGGQRQLM